MLIGVAVGLGLPAIDKALAIDLPVLSFDEQSSARSLLETIGSSTVAVAGLSFSVTVVAFTLASSQLSPRVLRSFRGDRLSQITLALLLGTFIYCLTLLVRLGVSGSSTEPPNLSITLAVVLALVSFAFFAAFIAHIVSMLQPAAVVAEIHKDAEAVLRSRFPSGPGDPEDAEAAAAEAERRIAACSPVSADREGQGYLNVVDTGPIIEAATAADALVRQRVPVGSYVLPGQTLAEIWREAGSDSEEEVDGELPALVAASFHLGRQRTIVQDSGFPIRQLADIALKGLSPGINDPTTAQNAMEELTSILVDLARSPQPSAVRVDAGGTPRFVADVPDFDDLVRLGFEQVRTFSDSQPLLARRLIELLDHLETCAEAGGEPTGEIVQQRMLIRAEIGERGTPTTDARPDRAPEG